MKRKVFSASTVTGIALFVIAAGIIFVGNSAQVNAGGDPAKTYSSKCAKCHGHDGRANTMRGRLTHARDLSKSDWQNDVSDERIFNSISNGKGKMPAFKKSLSDSQIDELVNYVRHLRH